MFNRLRAIFAAASMIAVLLGSPAWTVAEQPVSVKDCVEGKKGCGEDQIKGSKKEPSQAESQAIGVTIWDFVKMFFATAFVIALLYALLKFINKRSVNYKRSQIVENLGGTSLGTNKSIQVVKVGNSLLVIGVGENVRLLKEIEDREEINSILEEHNSKLEQMIQPSDIVTKLLRRTEDSTEREEQGSKFSALLKSQLDDAVKDRKKVFREMGRKGNDRNE
nr:flagellar biosynthetic protein FliO [Bacillus mediterraneensis]